MNEKKDVFRETDDEARRLAKTLLRTARFGALASTDAETGAPLATRVAVATDADGTPIILVSALSAHTPAILADPRCSLLLGEPGKGDPLAHPRISIACMARRLERGGAEQRRAERRYLNRHPKAKLYAQLGDFSYFLLEPTAASLNGGFAKAYRLSPCDLLAQGPVVNALAEAEQGAIDHMNSDHRDAIAAYARHFAKRATGDWTMVGIDPEGIDLASGDAPCRVFFETPIGDASDLRKTLVKMAQDAKDSA